MQKNDIGQFISDFTHELFAGILKVSVWLWYIMISWVSDDEGKFNNDGVVAIGSGAIGSILFGVMDGFNVPRLFNITIIDFFLKAGATMVFGIIGALSGLIAKEMYPPIKRYVKAKYKKLKLILKRK